MKGEIVINTKSCMGCGYCVEFCPRKCIAMSKDNFNDQGFLIPFIAHPEACIGCQICGWMCPAMAIEVYRFDQNPVTQA
jgi:NAD-dependent dihydropyrimidine dehydrogenase PreA subunit